MAIPELRAGAAGAPRGLWCRAGAARWVSAESWRGRTPGAAASVEDIALRYLAAFGPARLATFRHGRGPTRRSDAIDRLRSRLRTFRDESGSRHR